MNSAMLLGYNARLQEDWEWELWNTRLGIELLEHSFSEPSVDSRCQKVASLLLLKYYRLFQHIWQ